MILPGRIAVYGMIVTYPSEGAFSAPVTTLSKHSQSRNVKYRERIFDGIERSPTALIATLRMENVGKMMARIGEGA